MRRIAAALAACAILISCVPLDGIESEEETEMTRPTSLPEWASSPPVGAIVEPSAGQKQNGWAPGQRPPSQYLTWWMENVFRHVEYLDSQLHGLHEFWLPGSAFTANTDSTVGLLVDGEWRSSTLFTYNVDCALGGILRVGDRIRELRVYGVAGNAAGEIMTAILYRRGGATGSPTQVSTTKTSAATSGQANVAWTLGDTDFGASGHTVVAGAYYVQAQMPMTSAASEVRVYAVKLVFDRPEL